MSTATLKRRPRPAKSRQAPTEQRAIPPFVGNTMGSFFMPAASMTLDEFRRWTWSDEFPTLAEIAYIGKEIFIDMSPERIDSHGSPKVEIYTTLGTFVRKRKKGRIFFDRTRIVNKDAEVSNEPEAFFASWATLKSGAIRKIRTP